MQTRTRIEKVARTDADLARAIKRRMKEDFEVPDDRITLVAELVKVRVVDPDVLCKLELSHEARTNNESGNASIDTIFRRAFGQRRAISGSSANHPASLHIDSSVARVHPPYVRTKRSGVAKGIRLRIIEIIVALRIGGEGRIVLVGCQRQGSAAAPAAHQFCGNPFLLGGGCPMLAQKLPECPHVLL